MGDVNGDGRADLVCKDPTTVWVDYAADDFFQGTDFVLGTRFCTSTCATLGVIDINLDGRADLVCTNVDRSLDVNFADDNGQFNGNDDFSGTCSDNRVSFFPLVALPSSTSSALSSGDLKTSVTAVAAESHEGVTFVGVSGSSRTTLIPVQVTVPAPTVVSGHYRFWGVPLGSYQQLGATVRIVLDTTGRELCSAEQVLVRQESSGFSADGPLTMRTHPMSCAANVLGVFRAKLVLRAWATAAGPGSASVDAHVKVASIATHQCTAR